MILARPAARSPKPRAIAGWLLLLAVAVFLMVIVGGITRLTESGLSMVRWEPIAGTIPPTSTAEWQAEFDAYKASPEYRKVNRGMALGEFKQIFFWEYLHRLIGRSIGLAFLLPFIWFWWKRSIPRGYGLRLAALFALGGLQGAIGWWMVASGLVDRPDVSHLRLAIHLSAALFIFSGLIWTALDLRSATRPARLRGPAAAALALLTLQIMLGAWVAGLDAGFAFSSWPKMGEDWFPAGGWWPGRGLHNLVDNPIVVQFTHRWTAWVVAAGLLVFASWARRRGVSAAPALIGGGLALQITLGIATLTSGVALPIAAAHQAVAALLLAAAVAVAHRAGQRR